MSNLIDYIMKYKKILPAIFVIFGFYLFFILNQEFGIFFVVIGSGIGIILLNDRLNLVNK